ncbi:T9SS type A sorting domain-containing protein [Rurimicrobium arvi]|uniref:T9SS type A sorting domain-containing protein n=1 Tax=Rurimicrobium arvi TaxID=2049916 RepID=A0ABP8MVA8_9BACT
MVCFKKLLQPNCHSIKAIILFLSIFSFYGASAQSTCKILYSYDLGGNRIRREFNCDAPPNPWDNPVRPDHTLLSSLSPNPTSGGLTGVFTDPVPTATVQITDMGGAVYFTQTFTQTTSVFTMDISPAVPGTYLVTIWALGIVEGYTIIKM